jgi:hypothetical protein
MEGFAFTCRCPRCSAPGDDMRCVPCPACATAATRRGADGFLPKSVALRGARPAGVLTFTPGATADPAAGDDGSSSGAAEPDAWVCGSCGARLPDDDEAVFGAGERVIQLADLGPTGRVERGAAFLAHHCESDMAAGRVGRAGVGRTLEMVARVVGPDHWATHAMLRARSGGCRLFGGAAGGGR